MLDEVNFSSVAYKNDMNRKQNVNEKANDPIVSSNESKPKSFLEMQMEIDKVQVKIDEYYRLCMDVKREDPDADVSEIYRQLAKLQDYKNVLKQELEQKITKCFEN